MLTCEELQRSLDGYRRRYLLWQDWESKLLHKSPRQEWLTTLAERAKALSEIYCENNKFSREVLDPLLKGTEPLTDELRDLFYQNLQSMYTDDWADPFFLKLIAVLLLPHLEAHGNADQLVFAYLVLGYANTEIARTGSEEAKFAALYNYDKVTSFRDRFDCFDDPASRVRIFVAYSNLIFILPSLGGMDMDVAYHYWLEWSELVRQPSFARYRDEKPRLGQLADTYLEWYKSGSLSRINQNNTPDELKALLTGMAEQEYQHPCSDAAEKLTADLVTSIQYSRLERGLTTPTQAWQATDDFFRFKCDHLNPEQDDIISFYANTLSALIDFMMQSDFPLSEKHARCREYRDILSKFMAEYSNARNTYTLNSMLEEFCSSDNVLASCETKDEKMDFVFQMVVARHVTTFLHSLMVSRFAVLLTGAVIDHAPELFIGFRDLKSPAEVRENRGKLIRFAKEAALLHDIGKNGLIDIVNTQYRQIGDDEFGIIRTHPDKGAAYLSADPDFEVYGDIARGHHKFYNGKGGYPREFDNTASPSRIMIDVITLCDCLDAATDRLGRNYHVAKTVDQVIAEFQRDAGTRYNPDLVALLVSNELLLTNLRILSVAQRESIYYDACRQYFC